MKQLGLAFAQYSQDNDEQNPDGENWYYPGGNGWAGQIYAYVKSDAVFLCPDDTNANDIVSYAYNSNNTIPTGLSVSAYPLAKYNAPASTVLLFEVQGNRLADAPQSYSVSLPSTNQLSDQYFGPIGAGSNGYSAAGVGAIGSSGAAGGNPFYDVNGAGLWNNPEALKIATGYLNGTTSTDQAIYTGRLGRHQGGANYLMADDHAKWFQPNSVSAGLNNDIASSNCGAPVGPGRAADDWGLGTLAAGTDCSQNGIAATFSLF